MVVLLLFWIVCKSIMMSGEVEGVENLWCLSLAAPYMDNLAGEEQLDL